MFANYVLEKSEQNQLLDLRRKFPFHHLTEENPAKNFVQLNKFDIYCQHCFV